MGDMQTRSPPPLPRRTWVLPSPLGDSCSPSRRNLGMVGKGRGGNHQLLAAFLFLRGPGLASARDILTQGQERCVRGREDAEELQTEEISGGEPVFRPLVPALSPAAFKTKPAPAIATINGWERFTSALSSAGSFTSLC